MDMDAMLEMRQVTKRYENFTLDHVDFVVPKGYVTGLIGENGAGKTTLMKAALGLIRTEEGEILLDGKPLPTRGYSPVQLIYQHPEQAVNPRWKMERTLKECWEPDEELLKEMGIESEWLKRWPSELSGGELQRFCIARALACAPRYLVADESTAMFDAVTQARVWRFLVKWCEENGAGLVFVSHSPELIDYVATRTVMLGGR